jgi:twinkle protein
MINEDLLRDLVRSRIEDLCRHFFPHGRKMGNEWKLGNTTGVSGESLGIQLVGQKAGLYRDRATGEGGDFVKLLRENRNITFTYAAEQIGHFLGVNLNSVTVIDYPHTDVRKPDLVHCLIDFRSEVS